MSAIARVNGLGSTQLLPPRDAPYVLRDVLVKEVDGCVQELVLDCADSFLGVSVEEDTDSLQTRFFGNVFTSQKNYRSVGKDAPWNSFLGKECGWTWVGINQQGYMDSLLVSFGGIVPDVLLHVIASSISLFKISPV